MYIYSIPHLVYCVFFNCLLKIAATRTTTNTIRVTTTTTGAIAAIVSPLTPEDPPRVIRNKVKGRDICIHLQLALLPEVNKMHEVLQSYTNQ